MNCTTNRRFSVADDRNGDGLVNNGFPNIAGSGFDDSEAEVDVREFFSLYDLSANPRAE